MSRSEPRAVVSSQEAGREPYPYVFVNDDGTARELHPAERRYLEEPFSPFDGGRPYVKASFEARDGWGSIKGFLPRSQVPTDLSVAAAPTQDPNPPMTAQEYSAWLQEMIRRRVVGRSGTIEPKPEE